MRVSREQSARNRERILDAAAKLFKEHGFDGTGVDAVMKAAGLTHGGFYGHFASKDDLVAEVCERALARSLDRWSALAAAGGDAPVSAIAAHYLSAAHRDRPREGCLMAALGPEVGRRGESVREAFTRGIRPLIDLLARVAPGGTEPAKREAALRTLAGLVGAVVLARAVDDANLSDEILNASAAPLSAAPAPPHAR